MQNPHTLKLILLFCLWKYIHRDIVITYTFYLHNHHPVLNIQKKTYCQAFVKGSPLGQEKTDDILKKKLSIHIIFVYKRTKMLRFITGDCSIEMIIWQCMIVHEILPT